MCDVIEIGVTSSTYYIQKKYRFCDVRGVAHTRLCVRPRAVVCYQLLEVLMFGQHLQLLLSGN